MNKLVLLIPFFAPVIIGGALLAMYPHEVIRLQGKFYRRIYKGVLQRSDSEIDAPFMFPIDRVMMGKRSEFIQEAVENPQKYSSLMVFYRILGVVVLLFGFGACALAVLAAIVGALK